METYKDEVEMTLEEFLEGTDTEIEYHPADPNAVANTRNGIPDPLEDFIKDTYVMDNKYFIRNGEKYIKKDFSSLKRHLRVRFNLAGRDAQSQIDAIAVRIDQENTVDATGPFVGKPVGKTKIGMNQYLVTHPRDVYEPIKGNWDNIKIFIESLLENDPEQIEFFYGWMQWWMRTLIDPKKNTVGQGLVLMGGRGLGKSCLINLMGKLSGYPTAIPIKSFKDSTAFNGEFIKSSLFVLDDVQPERGFGPHTVAKGIVNIIFSSSIAIHPKGLEDYQASFPKRIVMATNTDMGSLGVVPNEDAVGKDKIAYLHCSQATLPSDNEADNNKILYEELNAFHHFLLYEFTIKPENRNVRTGVNSYSNHKVYDTLADNDPDQHFISLIVEDMEFEEKKEYYVGDMHSDFKNKFFDKYEIEGTRELGQLLSKLASNQYTMNKFNLRISKGERKTKGIPWIVETIKVKEEEEKYTDPLEVLR